MRPTLSEETVTKLKEIKEAILNQPSHFHMGVWAGESIQVGSSCGTAGCIAGWAVLLERLGSRWWDLFDSKSGDACVNFMRVGQEVLGLSEEQAKRLFLISRWHCVDGDIHHWPKQCELQLIDANADGDYREAAKVAARRIDLFIQSGGTI